MRLPSVLFHSFFGLGLGLLIAVPLRATTADVARISLIDTTELRIFPSPDGRHCLTQSSDGLRWWQRSKGKILRELTGPGDLSLANPVAPVATADGTQLFFATATHVVRVSLAEGRIIAQRALPSIGLLAWDDARQHLIAVQQDADPKQLAVHQLNRDLADTAPTVALPFTRGQSFKSWDPLANDYGTARSIVPAPTGGYYVQVSDSGAFLPRSDLVGDGYEDRIEVDVSLAWNTQLRGPLFTAAGRLLSLENHNKYSDQAYLRVLDPVTLETSATFAFNGKFPYPAQVRLVGPAAAGSTQLFTDGHELHLIDLAAPKDTPRRVIDSRTFGFSGAALSAAWANATHTELFLADDRRFGVYTLTATGLEPREDFRQGFARFTTLARDPLNQDLLATDSHRTLWRISFRDTGLLISAVSPEVVTVDADPASGTLFLVAREQGASQSAHYASTFASPDTYPAHKIVARTDKFWANETYLKSATFSPSGALASLGREVYDVLSGQLLFTIPAFATASHPNWRPTSVANTAICQDDAVVVAYDSPTPVPVPLAQRRHTLAAFDLATQAPLWETEIPRERVARLIGFDDDNHLHVLLSAPFELQVLDRDTGEILQRAPLDLPANLTPPFSLTLAADRSAALLRHGEQTSLLNLRSPAVVATFALPEAINDWQFDADSSVLIAAPARGGLLLISARTGETLARLVLNPAERRWAAFAPDGRFDMSGSLADDLYRVTDGTIQSLGQLQSILHQPNLLATVLGDDLRPPPVAVLPGLAELPTLRLTLAGAGSRGLVVEDDIASLDTEASTVGLTLSAAGVNLSDVTFRLYQNGKLLGTGTRGLFVEDDDATSSATFREQTYLVPLLPGENRFRAVAVTPACLESLPAELILTSRSPAVAAPSSGGLRLHALIIGINTYRNAKYNLNYAARDAEAFAAALSAGASRLYTGVSITTLFDAEATKQGIADAFRRISATAGPRDSFIFYFAGHGTVSTGDTTAFYLAPTEITQLYTDAMRLGNEAISTAELLEWSANLPAQKQLFLLDACQSGEALATVARRGAVEEKAIAQLARSSGTHWLTATGSQQFATEVESLGHGLFTYALLEALRGAADAGDQLVSVNELKANLEAVVPELSITHHGSAQFPASFGTGQDFPLVRVLTP